MNTIKATFSNNLIQFMMERSISRKQLCNDLGIKYTTLCDWINQKSEPKFETIELLSDYLGVNNFDFFIEINDRKSNSDRFLSYSNSSKMLSTDALSSMTDEQINELIKSGFGFNKLSLEDYSKKFRRSITPTSDINWGVPAGDELW